MIYEFERGIFDLDCPQMSFFAFFGNPPMEMSTPTTSKPIDFALQTSTKPNVLPIEGSGCFAGFSANPIKKLFRKLFCIETTSTTS